VESKMKASLLSTESRKNFEIIQAIFPSWQPQEVKTKYCMMCRVDKVETQLYVLYLQVFSFMEQVANWLGGD